MHPFTSTDEWLAGWMALNRPTVKQPPQLDLLKHKSKDIRRTLDAGAVINRADGYQYRLMLV
jgi:hypothetical protein